MPAQLPGRLFELTFGRPGGVLGRVGAAVMVRAIAEQEARAVDQAALIPARACSWWDTSHGRVPG